MLRGVSASAPARGSRADSVSYTPMTPLLTYLRHGGKYAPCPTARSASLPWDHLQLQHSPRVQNRAPAPSHRPGQPLDSGRQATLGVAEGLTVTRTLYCNASEKGMQSNQKWSLHILNFFPYIRLYAPSQKEISRLISFVRDMFLTSEFHLLPQQWTRQRGGVSNPAGQG